MSKGIRGKLAEEGVRVVGKAAGAVLSDPRGQEALARAVGLAQRGLKLLGAAQERALHAAGLAARPDYQDLRKQVARLKRKARELSERFPPAPSGEDAPGGATHRGPGRGGGDGSR